VQVAVAAGKSRCAETQDPKRGGERVNVPPREFLQNRQAGRHLPCRCRQAACIPGTHLVCSGRKSLHSSEKIAENESTPPGMQSHRRERGTNRNEENAGRKFPGVSPKNENERAGVQVGSSQENGM